MNRHIDTQIISYAYKGTGESDVRSAEMSSVAIKEFLATYNPENNKDHFYVPANGVIARCPDLLGQLSSRSQMNSSARTDRLILDFGVDFPVLVEYGSVAIARMVNMKNLSLLRESVAHMPKEDRRAVRKKFEFVCDNEIRCVALNKYAAITALEVFTLFLERHQPKNFFRNTANDILILSTAISAEARFETLDSALSRRACSTLAARKELKGSRLTLDFSRTSNTSKHSLESKRYINSSRQILQRKASTLGARQMGVYP